MAGDILRARRMCGEDLNIDPRFIHCPDAARAQVGKASSLEVLCVLIVDRIEVDEFFGGIGLFRGDKWQVLVA